ncbi:MAG: hypothetical protein ABDH31_06505 [Chlorobiota bacterium]
MGIEPIRSGVLTSAKPSPSQPTPERPTVASSTESQDTVALSPEAQQLQEAQRRERVELVRQRLATGFYSAPDVLRQVAHRIAELLLSQK